ncbi:MAG TPA: hypothetical protein VI409_08890, partial [Gaiellaceae bacterium]|nr:hypothetical protein [Gaiellaceae bacterium]
TVSSNPPADSPRHTAQAAGGRRRIWHVVVAVVLVALVAAVAGVFIGRATETGEQTGPALSWQPLPQAPIVGRLGPAAVWTGTEMIIWGGAARSGEIERGYEGAAYNPATRTWRTIAASPPGVQGGGAGVVWTGDEMVVWASNSPDGPVDAAVYDPSTDSWRRLPAGPLGKREGYASAWTGEELIVVGGSLGDTLAKPIAAALDPRTGSWRLLSALNRITGLMPSPGLVWDGHEAFVMGSVCAERVPGALTTSCSPTLLAYDPATDALRTIDLAKAPIAPQQQLKLIGVSGTDLVFATEALAKLRIFIVRYDLTTGSWSRKGAFAPFPVPVGAYTQTAWLGDRYVAADGSSGLQIYSLDTDTWQTITPGPSPLNSREGSAIVWTGTDLIAWSGTVYERFNPTPADGASLMLQD